MIKWKKLGRIAVPRRDLYWNQAYISLPTFVSEENNIVTVLFGGRDHLNRSRIGRLSFDLQNHENGSRIEEKPVLGLGELGTFDDNGVMPCSVVTSDDGRQFLYYVGWNPRSTTRYSFYSGLAISDDGGQSFNRFSRAPILERTNQEPFVNASPWVIRDAGVWRMYYVSGEGWIHPDLPRYNIKYAESTDGYNWNREGKICVDFNYQGEHALARPCVVKTHSDYQMWFSFKGADYDLAHNYRMGFASSKDGIHFNRNDSLGGPSPSTSGWDSEMIAYGCVFSCNGRRYMLYNGNTYGEAGMGLAIEDGTL